MTVIKVATGSDHALIFFNHVINQLLTHTQIIRQSFSPGITPEEKIDIINALQDKKYTFYRNFPWQESVKMVQTVRYHYATNKITVLANPDFHNRLKQTPLKDWPYKIKEAH